MTMQRRATRRDVDVPTASAIAQYHEAADRLELLAKDAKQAGQPLTARRRAQRALIALSAARAEQFDPSPRVAPTMVCCPNCVLYRAREA